MGLRYTAKKDGVQTFAWCWAVYFRVTLCSFEVLFFMYLSQSSVFSSVNEAPQQEATVFRSLLTVLSR